MMESRSLKGLKVEESRGISPTISASDRGVAPGELPLRTRMFCREPVSSFSQ